MSILKKNIVANLAGNLWQAVVALAFVPLYVKYLGVESYGLIGVFAAFQGLFVLLDMGLGATLTREMARLSVLPDRGQEMRDLVRSLEVVYWVGAAFICIVVVLAAPLVAHHWVNSSQLSPEVIEQAIRVMGFAIAIHWPASFYSGGLVGLQRQLLLNVVNTGMITLRSVGAVLVLWLVSATIQSFFLWQVIVSLIHTTLLASSLWRQLPKTGKKANFQKQLILGVWRFAAGISGISILATILTQLDKVILSKMLSLEMFGYYTLAGVVGMSLYRIIGPVFSAVYPRFTQLVSLGDTTVLAQLYHKSCQFMSVMVLPVAIVVAIFSYEIMLLWTQNTVTAEKSYLLVSVLICGTALNGLLNIPYALQLAYGWTRFGLFANLIAVILLVPMIVLLTAKYGALGGASAWVILNAGNVLVAVYFMHRRLLPGEKWRWYLEDVGHPLLASLVVVVFGRLCIKGDISHGETLGCLVAILIAAFAAAIIATKTTRDWVVGKISIPSAC